MSLMFIKNVEPSKIGYSITTTSLELNVNINNYFLGWNTSMLLWQQVSKQDGKCMYEIYMWHVLGKFQSSCTCSLPNFHFHKYHYVIWHKYNLLHPNRYNRCYGNNYWNNLKNIYHIYLSHFTANTNNQLFNNLNYDS